RHRVLRSFLTRRSSDLGIWLVVLEWLFTAIFTLDYIARIWVVTNKRKYIFSFFGIVDLLSILPAYLALFYVGAQSLIVIRSLRLDRKSTRLNSSHVKTS